MESFQGTDPKDRRERIAEAAYFRAEKRGFRGGDPVADWIDAEHEVEAQLRRDEHHRLLEELETRLATAGKKLKSLRKKVSTLTAEARKEVEQDVQKLAKLRDALEKRLDEAREQGAEASYKAKQHAEKLWSEISETIRRTGARRKPRP
jgi:F0F1-type ATP synthase membrane subunit b/b'